MTPTKAAIKFLAKSFGKYGITLTPTADGKMFILTDRNERPYLRSAPMTFDDARDVLAHIDEAVTEAFAHAIAGLTEAA